ncbi:MAG: hypothetical protein ACLFU8_04105 [Anaerolineales bacterium]
MRNLWGVRLKYVLLLAALLLLSGCDARVHTDRISDVWGRGRLLGRASGATAVGLGPFPDGEHVAVAWIERLEESAEEALHLLILEAGGEVVVDEFVAPVALPGADVSLLVGDGDTLHLLWTSGRKGERALWHLQLPDVLGLDAAALEALQPVEITPAERSVAGYEAAWHPDRGLVVLWQDARGELLLWRGDESVLLLDQVLALDFQLDAAGLGHVAWSTRLEGARGAIYQAFLDTETGSLSEPREVMAQVFGGRNPSLESVGGPTLILEEGEIYVSWTQLAMMGNQSQQQLFTVVLPAWGEAGEPSPPLFVGLSPRFPPPLQPLEGPFPYRALANTEENVMRSTSVGRAPHALRGQHAEAVVAVSALYRTRSREEFQPTLIYLRDGEVLGYEPAVWTSQLSLNPVVRADEDQNLYLAWVDAVGGSYRYPLYLATTNPSLQATWDQLVEQDLLVILGDWLNRIAGGVFIGTFLTIWLMVPLPWLIFSLATGSAYGNRARVAFLVGLLIYWSSKYYLGSVVLTYIPGLYWLSPGWAGALVHGLPLAILFVALVLVRLLFIRRDREFDLVRVFGTVVIIDWVLSNLVYAIGY